MSKTLSELLGADEPLFSISLAQLERASGQQSVDVRLTAEIAAKTNIKLRALGLDPSDTSGSELYHALLGLVKLHDSFLAKKLGVADHSDVKEVLKAIHKHSHDLPTGQKTWAIKHSVARKMLKAMPPKKVMKVLGYRSVASLLKRESPSELIGGVRFAESQEWQHKFMQQYAKLTPNDFETRDIEVIYYDPKKWNGIAEEFVKQTKHAVGHLKEMGAVLLAPLPVEYFPGITITTLPFVLHYMNEIRAYSTFFKTQQFKADFGSIIAHTLAEDPEHHAVMAGQGIHWRVVQRHYGQREFNQAFEPHLTSEDMAWHSAESALYRMEPALHFWHDMDYVGVMHDGKPVSFNLLDIAVSCVNNLNYGYQSTHHLRSSLWHELLTRYLALPALEQQVLAQLELETNSEFVEFNVEDF